MLFYNLDYDGKRNQRQVAVTIENNSTGVIYAAWRICGGNGVYIYWGPMVSALFDLQMMLPDG